MKKTWMMTTLALAAAGSVPAFADWSGKGEAGVAVASGNTDTKSANAKSPPSPGSAPISRSAPERRNVSAT